MRMNHSMRIFLKRKRAIEKELKNVKNVDSSSNMKAHNSV